MITQQKKKWSAPYMEDLNSKKSASGMQPGNMETNGDPINASFLDS